MLEIEGVAMAEAKRATSDQIGFGF
jgi:hypothetical protein